MDHICEKPGQCSFAAAPAASKQHFLDASAAVDMTCLQPGTPQFYEVVPPMVSCIFLQVESSMLNSGCNGIDY